MSRYRDPQLQVTENYADLSHEVVYQFQRYGITLLSHQSLLSRANISIETLELKLSPISACLNRYYCYTYVASQFVITFQFVINYYKLERICNTIASQFVINYYKL